MIELAISILWFLVGLIVLLGVVYLALLVVKLFVAVPDKVEKAIWLVALIICLIIALTILSHYHGAGPFVTR